ncbi:peptide ABC transporter substrate-binding protein [soil metagenome]
MRLLSAVAASALLVPACAPTDPPAELVFINGVEPETLDPAYITGQPEGRLASALFEGLTRFDAKGEPVPGVASSWEVSEDGKRYTFHLRPDARWSNGDPVTSDDFLRSWHRTLAPTTASDYASLMFPLLGAQAVNEGSAGPESLGVAAPNPQTLVVDLIAPTTYFLDLCAFVTFLPVPLPTIEVAGDEWIKPEHLVGNGPFTLESWRLNHRIRLQRSETYWDAANVDLASIDVLPINDANTALNFFMTGEADLMMDKGLIPVTLLGALREKDWFHTAPFLGTYFTRFNTTREPFDDPRVRKAFALAIDRERIVEKITRNGERPAATLVPPGTGLGYQPPAGLPHDPARARELLADAGFPGGKGFPLTTYLYPTLTIETSIAVELQSMWKDVLGVEVGLQKQEWKVYLATLKALDYDLGRSSWVGDYNDPSTFLDMFISGSGNNRTGYADPDYDALIDRSAREPDPEARYALLRDSEKMLLDDQAVVAPIYFYVGVQFYHPGELGGIQPNLLDEHPLQEIFRIPAREAAP